MTTPGSGLLEAGTTYLLKDIHPDDLANAIRLLLRSQTLIQVT